MTNKSNKSLYRGRTDEMREQEKLVKAVAIAGILILIGIMSIIAFRAFLTERNHSNDGDSTVTALEMDENSEEGGLVYRSKEEIQKELNRKVEEGMINISMNTSPTFESGTSKGNLLIVNSETNNYPQTVYIIRKDTGEEIYRSKGIPVGSKIERAALDVDLPAGIYDCVAYFNNTDPQTGEILGTAGAEITITVQS